MPVCSKCTAGSVFPSIQALYIHYKITHGLRNRSPYACAEENCLFQKSFSSWARMRKHYRTFHKFSCNAAPDCERVGVGHDVQEIENINEETIKFNDVDNPLLEDIVIQPVLDAFSAPFSSLSSDYLRLKYFEKSGNLIPATECVVGERYEYKFVDNRIVGMPVPCTATHIPLRLTLKKFFELPGIFATVLNYVNQLKGDDGVLSNFIQGNLWRKKSALYEAEGKTVLPLFLGIDDLEINNALGSHTGVSQVGAVYVSTPCLPPEFYSQLNNIFLNFLYYSQDRKLPNGNFEVFKSVFSELNFLARNGIWLKTESGNKRVYFVLGLILGDNKGLNEVLGFSGSFSANLYCRFCKRHRNDCSYDCEELSNYIRKSEDYETDVTLGVNVSGVKEKSVWLEVDYFDPVENFAACTLHDFDEGISRYAMPQICHFFISVAKIFDLAFLNERILSFNYQINGFLNKPSVITEDNLKKLNFRMSGSEMRTFALCFNFLVGDYVPLECDIWRYYLVLRRLLEYVSCRAFPRQCLPQLKNLIQEHNSLYLKVFGPLKPKMHLLVHYPHILVESGPMHYLSMIRNEGKHKEIKESAAATNSRKNVTHTLALKQQLKLCYRFTSEEGLQNETLTGRSQIIENLESLENYGHFSDSLPDYFKESSCLRVKWVTFKGSNYREGMCVVLDLIDDGSLPYFGIIKTILYNSKGQVCLICLKLFTSGFDSSLGAYEIESSNDWTCVLIEDLLNPFPVIKAILSNGKKFVGLKQML